MAGWLSNSLKWSAGIAAAALSGCSIHPIPDNVSRYDTAEIARNVRCEAKETVRARIEQALHQRGIFGENPETVLADKASFERIRRRDPKLARKFQLYGLSAITYDFEFDITETNNNSGNVNFEMPFTGGGQFSLLLDGQFDKKRQGIRKFTSVETFAELVKLKCGGWTRPRPNGLYPLTGSIGVGRIINTFINISEMGSMELDLAKIPEGEKAFKDVIIFTTEVEASVTPTLKLTPLPDRLRPTDASITHDSTRKDIHQITITLLFPNLEDIREAASRKALPAVVEDTVAKALENNCVATERAREDRFGMLRRIPPALYCRRDRDDPRVIGDPLADDIR